MPSRPVHRRYLPIPPALPTLPATSSLPPPACLRRPYFFVLLNAAVSRVFNLHLRNKGNESLMEPPGVFWVVGADGGLRHSPTSAPAGIQICERV